MTGKNKINIALIGCVWSTETAYDALLRIKNPNINLKLLITKKNSKFNSDFVNLTKKSNKDNIPIRILNPSRKGFTFFLPPILLRS